MRDKYLFDLSNKIQDIIDSYNTMKMLSNKEDEVNKFDVMYDDMDCLFFKTGRINITAEDTVEGTIRYTKGRIHNLKKTLKILKSKSDGTELSNATRGTDWLCYIKLQDNNQENILNDIRELFACLV